MDISELVESWKNHSTTLAKYGDDRGAALLEAAIGDLVAFHSRFAQRAVSLREAAAISGYDEDTIGRWVRSGRLANYGKRHRPLVQVSQLPRKLAKVEFDSQNGEISPTAIRSIVTSKFGGH